MQWIALLLTSFLGFANEPANLLEVAPRQEKQGFVTELKFDKPVQADSLNVQFINETVQIDIPGVQFPGKQKSSKISNPLVKSVYTYQMENDTIRSRIIYKGVSAESFKDAVQVFSDGNNLRFVIGSHPEKAAAAEAKAGAAIVAPLTTAAANKEDAMLGMGPATLVAEEKKENVIAAENLVPNVAEAAVAGAATTEAAPVKMTAEEIAKKTENEIPVLANAGKKEAASSSTSKVLLTVGVLLLTILAGFVGLKKWSGKVGKNLKQTQIKVLTQHYLGPKKSLAIVRVAGESILIGVTDQNITMIKSLALLDEEIPEEVPHSFNSVMARGPSTFSGASARQEDTGDVEEFSFGAVKDVIRSKLKGNRSFE